MAGSHLDTVPEGGAFDGSLGACVALECVRAMKDAGIEPPRRSSSSRRPRKRAVSAACSVRRRLPVA